jgi:Cysteine-rich secretory protein family
MKSILCIFFSVLFLNTYSQGSITLQDKPFIYNASVDTSIQNALEREPSFKTLPQAEQKMFYWVNAFRKNPKRFYTDVIKEFLRQFPEANKPEVKSLERDIDKLKTSMPLFVPDAGLAKMSSTHSLDLSRRGGVISHKSASGKDFVQRIKEAGGYKCGAENIFVGNNNPLEALIMLLIDYGVADKGHRVNLMDPTFKLMGASFSKISNGKAVIVQVFGCK